MQRFLGFFFKLPLPVVDNDVFRPVECHELGHGDVFPVVPAPFQRRDFRSRHAEDVVQAVLVFRQGLSQPNHITSHFFHTPIHSNHHPGIFSRAAKPSVNSFMPASARYF